MRRILLLCLGIIVSQSIKAQSSVKLEYNTNLGTGIAFERAIDRERALGASVTLYNQKEPDYVAKGFSLFPQYRRYAPDTTSKWRLYGAVTAGLTRLVLTNPRNSREATINGYSAGFESGYQWNPTRRLFFELYVRGLINSNYLTKTQRETFSFNPPKRLAAQFGLQIGYRLNR